MKKYCKKCDQVGEFYSSTRTRDGLQTQCKKCQNTYSSEWQRRNTIKTREKSLRYRNNHKEECIIRFNKWLSKNIEHRKAYKKKYREGHVDDINRYNAEWYLKNKEYDRFRKREWTKKNYYHCLAKSRARRAKLKVLSDGTITNIAIQNMLTNQRGKCVYCNKDISKRFTLDHIYPVSKGGLNTIRNIQLLCKSCNSKKYNKTQFLLKDGRLIYINDTNVNMVEVFKET
jgi:5-methylcytosine-specific restriction endonuclease McrA